MAGRSGIELEVVATRSSGHGSDESNIHETGPTDGDGGVASSQNPLEGIDTTGLAEDPPSPTPTRSSIDSPIPGNQLVGSVLSINTQENAPSGSAPPSPGSGRHSSPALSLGPGTSSPVPVHSTWLPISLQPSYLIALALLSFALGLACTAMELVSDRRSGLVEAKESNGFNFSWRFLPTITAVLYTLPWIPVMQDILRTEPYALMAQRNACSASESILRETKPWFIEATLAIWNRRTKSGGIRWAKFLAIIATMSGPLLVNPLSAGLLKVAIVPALSNETFSTFARPTAALNFSAFTDTMYLSTLSNLVHNTTSSAWFTKNYIAVPFWPSKMTRAPLGAQIAPTSQTWNTTTDIFRLELDCQKLITVNLQCSALCLLTLKSSDGCFSQTTVLPSTIYSNGTVGFWGQFNVSIPECGRREYLALIRRDSYNEDLSAENVGYICSTTYLTKSHQISVATSSSSSSIEPEDAIFNKTKGLINSPFINTTQFDTAFANENGSENFNFFLTTKPEGLTPFIGPSLLLATLYNFNISAMFTTDPAKLIQDARMIKQQFFNVALLSVFDRLSKTSSAQSMTWMATTTTSQPRLLVIRGFGYSLGALLVLLGFIAIALVFMTNLTSRPLHLEHDPATPAFHALLLEGTGTIRSLERLDQAPAGDMRTALGNHAFEIQNGRLIRVLPTSDPPVGSRPPNASTLHNRRFLGEWNPWYMGILSMGTLFAVLTGCVAVLLWAWIEFRGNGIYQEKLLRSKSVRVRGITVFIFAVYSVFPTLIAALVKVYWSSFDDLFRLLTPFVAIVKEPQDPMKGALLSYITAPIAWISIVAAKNGHWALLFITLGSLAAEVLQITISGLWAVEPGVLKHKLSLPQDLTLRTTPIVFEHGLTDSEHWVTPARISIKYPEAMRHLYGGINFYNSWLFDGIVQVTQNKTSPPWSSGKWGIPPVNLSNIITDPAVDRIRKAQKTSRASIPLMNITFETSALSGDLICTPYDDTRWLVRNWIENNGNKTSNLINHGQWFTPSGFPYSPFGGSTLFLSNFTIFWGFADHLKSNYSGPTFDRIPQVQGLDCQPTFERVNGLVTASIPDGKILKFEQIGSPVNATEAWTHPFTKHFYNVSDYDKYQNNTLGNTGVRYNETVSWGYLFHLALLQASFNYGYGSYSRAVFSFDQKDFLADFCSAAALSQVGYNLTALLNANTLAQVSRRVFQTFFQAFISLDNGYNGHWAYEKFDEKLPEDLDFQPQVAVTTTGTITSKGDYCGYSTTTNCVPTGRDISTGTWTQTYTTYLTQNNSLSIANVTASSVFKQLARASSTSTAPPSVEATISIEAPVLKVSPAALWSSVFLFAVLLLLTIFAFFQQRRNSRMLPRNIEAPMSVMAFVHASESLQEWAKKTHDDNEWDEHSGTRVRNWWRARNHKGLATSAANRRADRDIMVAMGPFGQNWGIEMTKKPSD